jgi:hypothetical protein
LSKQNRAKGKSQGKREKASNKIMRDYGIMVFLWRIFLHLATEKKKIKKIKSSNTYKGFLFLKKRGKVARFRYFFIFYFFGIAIF